MDDGFLVAGGIASCDYPVITGDGTGGAIIAWQASGGDCYVIVQRVDANCAIQWTSGGLYVCGPGSNREYPGIVSDGQGGAYIGWMDDRHGDYLIYAQRVDTYGNFLWTDEGGRVCQNYDDQLTQEQIMALMIYLRILR